MYEFDNQCPFTPAITNHSRNIVNKKRMKPIHQRYEKEMKQKTERLEFERKMKEKREKRLLSQTLKKSKKRHKRKRNRDCFVMTKSRDLYLEGQKSVARKRAKRIEEHARRVENNIREVEYLFSPKINPKSREYVKASKFEDRQKLFSRRKSRRIRNIKKSEKCSFKPRLNKKSRDILNRKMSRGNNNQSLRSLHSQRTETRKKRRRKKKNKRRFGSKANTARSIDSRDYFNDSIHVQPLALNIKDYFNGQKMNTMTPKMDKKSKKIMNVIFKTSKYSPTIKSKSKGNMRYGHNRTLNDDDSFGMNEAESRVPFGLSNHQQQQQQISSRKVTKRLFKGRGKENRRSVIVASKPEKKGQRALSFKKNMIRDKKRVRKGRKNEFSMKFGDAEENEIFRKRSKSRGKKLRKKSKGKGKTVNQLEFEEFEKFCGTLGSFEEFDYDSGKVMWNEF